MTNETTFTAQNGEQINLLVEKIGITFLHVMSNNGVGDVFQVGQKWSSIRDLLKTISYGKKYSSKDNSLFVWKESNELHMKFRSLGTNLEKECIFSSEETEKLLGLLEANPFTN